MAELNTEELTHSNLITPKHKPLKPLNGDTYIRDGRNGASSGTRARMIKSWKIFFWRCLVGSGFEDMDVEVFFGLELGGRWGCFCWFGVL